MLLELTKWVDTLSDICNWWVCMWFCTHNVACSFFWSHSCWFECGCGCFHDCWHGWEVKKLGFWLTCLHCFVNFSRIVLPIQKIGWTRCWCWWFWIWRGNKPFDRAWRCNSSIDEASCHVHGHFVLNINVRDVECVHDQLGVPYKKVQMNFLGKTLWCKIELQGQGA
jgi:hypothetical protein